MIFRSFGGLCKSHLVNRTDSSPRTLENNKTNYFPPSNHEFAYPQLNAPHYIMVPYWVGLYCREAGGDSIRGGNRGN